MKCALNGCSTLLTNDQIRKGCKCCSISHGMFLRNGKSIPLRLIVIPREEDYQMKCCVCEKWYDGRKGPMIGVCSIPCVGVHAMHQVAGEAEARKVG